MVNERVKVRDKHRVVKRVLKVLLILFIVGGILSAVFFFGFFSKSGNKIVLENPLKNLVFANTNAEGQVDYNAVLQQGILEFDEDYINYLLVALGVGNLHSMIGFGNPIVEFNLDGEVWNSEVIKGGLNTRRGLNENKDLVISISKKEAVKGLLSSDLEQFMKDSVYNGNTQIEMVAGKIELFGKGYLSMYTQLTGEEEDIE